MTDIAPNHIRKSDRKFLQTIESELKQDATTLLAVRALAVPVRLDPELALTILQSPLVNTNGNSAAILGKILHLPFIHRFPDGTFKYSQDARVYFDEQLQQGEPGGNGNGLNYARLNRLLADFYQERKNNLNGGVPQESREARQLVLSESLHRLADKENLEQGLEDLGGFIANDMGPTARADTFAALNICRVREPLIGAERLETLFIQAKYFYLARDYKAASPRLQKVCAFPPETFLTPTRKFIFALASHFLGYVKVEQGRPDLAITWLRKSVEMGRTLDNSLHTAMSLNTLGVAYLALRPAEPEKAIKALEESVRLSHDPANRAIRLNTLGNAYLALRPAEPEKAIKALEESVRLAPDDASRAMSFNTLGNAYLALRPAEVEKAVKALEESVRLSHDPANRAIKLNTLGNAYLALRPAEPEKAVKALEESVRLAADDASRAMSLNTLGNAYLALRPAKAAEAVAALEESVRLSYDPIDRAKRLTTLSKAHLRGDDPETAIVKLQESLSLLAESPYPMEKAPTYNLLGQSYEKLPGKQREAIAAYRAAEAMNRGRGGNRKFAEEMARRAARLEDEMQKAGQE